jgi:hypothetical protein
MPRATCKYQFEWKIFNWVKHLSHILTGHPDYAFFMVLAENGLTRKIILGDHPETFDHKELEGLQQEASCWLFHDPFEGPVYTFVQWQNVGRGTVERLMGAEFEPDDFLYDDKSIEFSTSWGVMF